MSIFGYTPCPIGLDVSDLSIKLLQLKKRGDKFKIQAVGKISLPAGILEDGEIKDKEELARALRKLFNKPSYGKIYGNEIIVCLPETKTFLKILEIDKNYSDIKEVVKIELEKNIPLPADGLYYDYQIIRESSRSQILLLTAAPKELVEKYITFFKEIHLTTAALETEQLSICRAILPEEHIKYKGENLKNYAIIDIGATSSSMTVYAKNTIVFSVSIPISGEDLTRRISETLEIEPERAEKAKIIYSLQEGEEQPLIKKVLSEMINDLIKKSQEAINFFHHHFSTWGPIDKIILAGGGANIKNIEKIIEKGTGIETVRGDALINLGKQNSAFLKIFQETLSLYINFSSDEKLKSNSKKQEDKTLKVTQNNDICYTTAIGLALRGAFNHE